MDVHSKQLCADRAVNELSSTASQKQAQILALAKQSAEQGIGDNDLKRLKRQFDSNKATYVNIDQKQRFMQGKPYSYADIGLLIRESHEYCMRVEGPVQQHHA